jgi:hypothetical protein
MDEYLDWPLSLNEEDAVRAHYSGAHLHFKKRTMWRKTPREIANLYSLDAAEIAKAAGRVNVPAEEQ